MELERRRDLRALVELIALQESSDSDFSSSDEEDMDFLLLELSFKPKKILGPRINLDDLSEVECEQLFRFSKEDMVRLSVALGIPKYYICPQGTKATGMEALMLMLRRFAYPSRLCDLVPLFGRAEQELSQLFNTIVKDIHTRFCHLLESFDLLWMDPATFSAAIHAKGSPLTQCFGFIDSTVRPISRPTVNQRIMYSGHKRVHCLKFQSVSTPNGLIAHMFGPLEGRRHDAFMLSVSGLPNKLRSFNGPCGDPYVLYGDPAYGVSRNILSPFRSQNLTPAQQEFNKNMSAVRVTVEWAFGKILQYFPYLDFKKNQKVLLQPIGKYYLVGTLLTNCHSCLYGSPTGTFFPLDPPSLETYLSNR